MPQHDKKIKRVTQEKAIKKENHAKEGEHDKTNLLSVIPSM